MTLRSLRTTICAISMFAGASVSAIADSLDDPPTPAIDAVHASEIANLATAEKIQLAFANIVATELRSRDLLIELTEIPAPPFGEEARALRYAELLREEGLADVSIDEVGNVVGRRPGRKRERTVALSAHLDTVFPAETDVTVKIEGDTMFAPGIGDNSRGLVVVLAVLRALEYAAIDTEADLLFIGNVGEEGLGDLRGVKHLFSADGPRIDSLIVIDGGDTDRIVYGGVGSHRYRVTFQGPGGHSWGAFGTVNPHHALGRAISAFVASAAGIVADGPRASYSIGRVGGGTSINSIPFESWMEVDMRSGDQSKLDELDAALHAAVQQAVAEENASETTDSELTVQMERVGTRPAALGDPEGPLVQRAMAATSEFDLEPQLRISSTDANYPISLGIPAITLSRGGISKDGHALTESWQNVDGHLAIQIGLLTLLAEAGFVP